MNDMAAFAANILIYFRRTLYHIVKINDIDFEISSEPYLVNNIKNAQDGVYSQFCIR